MVSTTEVLNTLPHESVDEPPEMAGSDTVSSLDMPADHPPIDGIAHLAIDAIAAMCPAVAKSHEVNPSYTESIVSQYIQNEQQKERLRQQGKGDEEIEKDQWATMLNRHRDKTEARKENSQSTREQGGQKPEKAAEDTKSDTSHTGQNEQATAASPVVENTIEASVTASAETTTAATHEASSRREVHQEAKAASDIAPSQHKTTVEARSVTESSVTDRSPSKRVAEPTLVLHVADTETIASKVYVEQLKDVESDPVIEAVTTTDHDLSPRIIEAGVMEPVPDHNVEKAGTLDATGDDTDIDVVKPLEAERVDNDDDLDKPQEFSVPVEQIKPPELLDAFEMETVPAALEIVEPIAQKDELEKKPKEILDDFVTALEVFMTPHEGIDDDEPVLALEDEVFIIAETLDYDEESRAQPEVPAIATMVSERLGGLGEEEEETVALLTKDIVESIQTIDTREADEVATEQLGAVKEELKERIVVLFEELGIEYEPEDVEDFASMLLEPDFELPQPEEELPEEVDLENDGTHEGKYTFAQAISVVADEVERDIQHFIGKFALFHHNRQWASDFFMIAA